MIDAGILGEGERVQLIDGLLVSMTPQSRRHAFAIQQLNRLLVRGVSDEFSVLTQLPLTLADDSEPEPDLAVVRTGDAESVTEHPSTALLVIEVAGESLRFDRRTKAALYARAGVPEYWIVNLSERVIEVYRNPESASGAYLTSLVCRPGEFLAPAVVPGIRIDVAALFPDG